MGLVLGVACAAPALERASALDLRGVCFERRMNECSPGIGVAHAEAEDVELRLRIVGGMT